MAQSAASDGSEKKIERDALRFVKLDGDPYLIANRTDLRQRRVCGRLRHPPTIRSINEQGVQR